MNFRFHECGHANRRVGSNVRILCSIVAGPIGSNESELRDSLILSKAPYGVNVDSRWPCARALLIACDLPDSEEAFQCRVLQRAQDLRVRILVCSRALSDLHGRALLRVGIVSVPSIPVSTIMQLGLAMGIKVVTSLSTLDPTPDVTATTPINLVGECPVSVHISDSNVAWTHFEDVPICTLLVRAMTSGAVQRNVLAARDAVAAAFLMHDDGYLLVGGGATEAALAAAFDDAAEKAADATERCVQRAFSRGLQAIVRQLAAEQSCPVESRVEVLRTRVRNESERTQTVTEAAGMANTPRIWWGWDCSAQRPGDMLQASVFDVYRSKVQMLRCTVDTVARLLQIDHVAWMERLPVVANRMQIPSASIDEPAKPHATSRKARPERAVEGRSAAGAALEQQYLQRQQQLDARFYSDEQVRRRERHDSAMFVKPEVDRAARSSFHFLRG